MAQQASLLGLVTLLLAPPLAARVAGPQDGILVGEPPPPLEVAAWLHGAPVDVPSLAGTNVCLVEFWATWCPPCLIDFHRRTRAGSPFLAPELVRVAVTEEPPATVDAVLGAYPGELGIRVACDDDGRTTAAWLEASGEKHLPWAVLIDRQGNVAWRGDPRAGLEDVLPLVLAGTWDPAAGPAPAAAAPAPEVPPATVPELLDPVPAAAAVADLEHLRAYLSLHYAGYDDLAWKLLCRGSSWEQRTRAFTARIEARESWPLAELGDLVHEFLAPVQDSHFWLQVPGEPRRFLVSGLDPFFTDLRLRRAGDAFVVVASDAGPAALVGRTLRDVPLVAIEDAAVDRAYLFPTPADSPAHEEFLLGRFGAASTLDVTLRDEAGSVHAVALPLHRGRAGWTGEPLPWEDAKDLRPWSLREVPDAPWPLLAVRTMAESRLGPGLAATAVGLRDEPVLILDLRGNGGGSDTPAYEWCGGFSPQRFRNCAGAGLERGVAEGPGRWTCHRNSEFTFTDAGRELPYAGRLVILIDRAVASSGETFVRFASQIPGAVLVGENTMGCVSYGNCTIVEPLPASGITVRFGHTKFVENTVVPVREGVGFFPALWLDEPDVYAGIARLLGE